MQQLIENFDRLDVNQGICTHMYILILLFLIIIVITFDDVHECHLRGENLNYS